MINLNGQILSDSSTIISIQNRAFKYGDGLFETIKVTNGRIHFLEDHYFRLMASMRMLRFEIPLDFTMEFFEAEILKTVVHNTLDNARVRCTVYRKDGGFYCPLSNEINFLIEASKLKNVIKTTYSLDLYKDFYMYSGLLSTVKTTNKMVNVLAGIYAKENNIDNCVLLNEKKNVVEVTNGNIFLVFGNVIKTPAITEGCIKGISRKKIIELIEKSKIYTVEETTISPFELQKADEVFISNAIIGIQAVSSYKKSTYNVQVSTEINKMLQELV